METTARLEAQRAEVEADAARRNVGNQPVYALIYKDERIIGYIEQSGQWIMDDPSVNVFDIAQSTGFQNPQKMSDWIEKNMSGITVKKFSAGEKSANRDSSKLHG
ncbi:hypothetical protein VZ95_19330 [Elstera litoralis]|uniref:Uncharacterized protein n=1 Tax=Elstera litoralis TaxID=552518 RepID=A0A0F3IRI4_9PROT|nr:hypothetical protein [Elstera litoralis]KJV08199.1 hypothetical protein VZ95_19330 [Elstera litoralis]